MHKDEPTACEPRYKGISLVFLESTEYTEKSIESVE